MDYNIYSVEKQLPVSIQPAFGDITYLPFKDNIQTLIDFSDDFDGCEFAPMEFYGINDRICSVWNKQFNTGNAWLFGWNWKKK